MAYFLDAEALEKDLNTDNFLGSGGAVAREFAVLLRSLTTDEGEAVDPSRFKVALGQAAEQFTGSDQQDSQEFAAYLLDVLHEDLNRVRGRKPVVIFPDLTPQAILEKGEERAAAECWNLYLQRDKSIIVDLFQGQLRSQITCSRCGFLSTKFDSFMYLSLPVVDHTGTPLDSLADCLREFAKEERLFGDDRWFCPKCKQHVDAVKRLSLWKAPPVLLVHFKRFRVEMGNARPAPASASWYGMALYDGLWCSSSLSAPEVQTPVSKKLSHKVHFDLEGLDLSALGALPAASAQKVPPVFDAFALVDHFGSCGFGHYTGTVRHEGTGRWYRYNDDAVTPLEEHEVVGDKAYLLFFRRRDGVLRTQTQSFPDAWPHRIERDWSFLDAGAGEIVEAI